MHFKPFRSPGATRHWLQFWVFLLLVPACFALSTMSVTVAAVALTLTFGLPLAMWLGLNVHSASDLRRRATGGIRFAAAVSVTGLGLIGLFVFSTALALAAVAAYVVTVGVTAWFGSHSRPLAGPTAVPTPETPIADEPEPAVVAVTPDEIREMTDAELCHAWRRSFLSLERARGAHQLAVVVQTRQLLLDEVEARHPAGLRAWLNSGARAAGGPDRFIGGSGRPEAA